MAKYAATILLCAILAVSLWGKGVRYGMSRAEVEATLGKPTVVLTHDARLVLLYPKNGRVEFEQGVAVRMVNVPIDTGPPATAATTPAPVPAIKESAPSKDDRAQTAEAEMEKQRQEYQRRLEEATERLEEQHGRIEISVAPRPAQFWTSFAIGLAFRMLITVVVLKLAFKWSDVHADWSQMLLPALADTLTQAGIGAGAFALWKSNQLFYLDAAVSYFVLVGVLMKTTHACTLQRAVAVAGAAKLAALVVWAGVSVMLLHLLT